MFKQFITLMRGAVHQTAEDLTDRQALLVLQQQINDSSRAVGTARKAVAIALAQNEQETVHLNKLLARIQELEERTVAALAQGEDSLAQEAAETIAALEEECDTTRQAQKLFTTEIIRLKGVVREAEVRLGELKRGQRIAVVTDKTQKLRTTAPTCGMSNLKDAETTLKRLRGRQKVIERTAEAMGEMDVAGDQDFLIEKLAKAGCGKPRKTTAEMVLSRLQGEVVKNA